MRQLLLLNLLLLMALATGCATVPLPAAIDANELRQVQERRFAAMVHGDIPALEQILADDLSYTHTTGVVETREQFLDNLRTGAVQYLAISTNDVTIRQDSHVAILTGTADMQVATPDEQLAFAARFTEVYVRRDGQWRLVLWQSTRLPE